MRLSFEEIITKLDEKKKSIEDGNLFPRTIDGTVLLTANAHDFNKFNMSTAEDYTINLTAGNIDHAIEELSSKGADHIYIEYHYDWAKNESAFWAGEYEPFANGFVFEIWTTQDQLEEDEEY